jgi:hypothetical protein
MTDSPLTFSRHFAPPSAFPHLPRMQEPTTLDACSLCLRVRQDSHWIEAETAIRAFRSFEHAAPPRLRPAVCDTCANVIALRRSHGPGAKAA